MTVLTVFLYKSLAMLLLFLTLDLTLQLTNALSTSSPTTQPHIRFVSIYPDYDTDYADSPSDPPSVVTPAGRTRLLHELCQYDPCQEDQPPCADLSARSGCLCPGLSGAQQTPHPPRLQGLLPPSGDGEGSEVRWCAPSSVVSGYRVVVEGDRGTALEFGAQARGGRVGPLEAGAQVCVEAVNKAGHSAASESSCTHYQPPALLSSSVKAGLIGGGVALLLLVVIAMMILWRWRARRKTTEGSAEGLGNPSFSTEGHL
ncbi:hypothetical protein NHX12_011106 [Muraenolepis orangiensis]|uniref:LRRN4 C-terminal-like protein n=1 Tax=Muraenolepis orangiensis TaxID=630683 RepID=A0A9Q0DEL5_9TELE|nr:hypothetical protein NHX12_011106 [Muraenolepis orangiensis]